LTVSCQHLSLLLMKRYLVKLNNPFILGLMIFVLAACHENYVPKPRVYQRIYYPRHDYQLASTDSGFSSEIPVYSVLYHDSSHNSEPCWFNLVFLPFKAKLHLSYKPVNQYNTLDALKEDARNLVYKHTVKADEIEEKLFFTPQGNSGIFYELSGSTATAISFYLTDSTTNFIRGALYFSSRINRDSLDPVINFLKADIQHFIETLKWQNHK